LCEIILLNVVAFARCSGTGSLSNIRTLARSPSPNGHTEPHKWKDPETLKCARDGGNQDGAHFLTARPGNPDLA
jgi:hypothetical protein